MWENNTFFKMSRSVNMEFLHDIDMLEMIRWPSMETTTSDDFETKAACQALGPYNGLIPFQHVIPYSGASSIRSSVPEDSEKYDCYSNRMDCDDTLMVTSNDALRFEEDCLFESPSPSCRNVQQQSVTGADSSANRFLCQKNSMADMTLAELNDSNASDTSHKVELALLKTEVQDLEENCDPLSENFLSKSKTVNTSSIKEQAVAQLLPLKHSNTTQQPLFIIKDEHEGFNNAVKYDVKAEHVSPAKCSFKAQKAMKRSRTLSVALSDVDSKDERNIGLKTTAHQEHDVASVSSNCLIAEKKIKLEITDSSCDRGNSRVVVVANGSPSKSVMSEEENVDSEDISDTESVLSKGSSVPDLMRPNSSDKQFFWQYNIQAKGPKEKRLCKNISTSDPHVLKDFEDPVFDPGHSNVYFVHSGKARKGDGTDITPNPQKLLQIGSELKMLNSTIEEMMQASDFVTRTTTMKEKNKYASRVCRLKKKAQHEANKIKLHGLNEEHNQLMLVLNSIKSKLRQHKTSAERQRIRFTEELDNLTKSSLKVNVAGRADDYVSSILLASSTSDEKDDIWLYSD